MAKPQPLKHLDAATLQELMDRYYAGENIAALNKEFGVTCRPADLWRYFPPAQLDRNCPMCGAPLILPSSSRTAVRFHYPLAACCSACQHNETMNCTCSKCMANRQLAKEEMLRRGRTVIPDFCQRRWAYTPLEITPRQLSAEVAVAFLSLVRCGRWIDDETIGPLRRSAIPFTPKGIQFQRQLIDILLDNGLIAPSPDSPQSAFSKIWSKEACWNPKAVHWRLLVPNPPAFIRQLKSVVASTDWPDGWREGCVRLWRELAMAECRDFCAYSVAQFDLPMPAGTALSALIDNLLRDFSVSQCCQLLWTATEEATDYRVRKVTTARHASKYLTDICQLLADRTRAEGWEIKGFAREFQLPRSQVSHVLHDVFLRHGEVGFSGPINPSVATRRLDDK